jgi:glycerophosphoryl diester phosphodiesterase
MQKKGIALQVHTLNSEAEMRKYLDLKVDSILTDYPSRLAALLGK